MSSAIRRPAVANFEGGWLRRSPRGGRGASVLQAGARDPLGPRLEDEPLDRERNPEVQQQGRRAQASRVLAVDEIGVTQVNAQGDDPQHRCQPSTHTCTVAARIAPKTAAMTRLPASAKGLQLPERDEGQNDQADQ
jgi:hypothetical protein